MCNFLNSKSFKGHELNLIINYAVNYVITYVNQIC